MSIAGAAPRQRFWPRFRLYGRCWQYRWCSMRCLSPAAYGAGSRNRRRAVPTSVSKRIGAQLSLAPAQRAAFEVFIAELRGRGDKVQQQIVPLYRAAWDAAGKPAMDTPEVMLLVRGGVRRAAARQPRDNGADAQLPRHPVAGAARRFVALARAPRLLAETLAIISSRTAGRRRRRGPARCSRVR